MLVVGTKLSGPSLKALAKALGKGFDSKKFLSQVVTNDLLEETLEQLKKTTASSIASFTAKRREYRTSLGIVDSFLDQPLANTWRIRRRTTSQGIFIEIYSLWETQGGERGKAKLYALEYGRPAGSYVAERTFRFYGNLEKAGGFPSWITIRKGREVKIAPLEPSHEITRAKEMIELIMWPLLSARVENKVRLTLTTEQYNDINLRH
jgi:hypothetical protein